MLCADSWLEEFSCSMQLDLSTVGWALSWLPPAARYACRFSQCLTAHCFSWTSAPSLWPRLWWPALPSQTVMDKWPPWGRTDLGSAEAVLRMPASLTPCVLKHALDTQACSSFQTLKLFIAAANGVRGPRSQGVEVTSETPFTHE